MKFHNLLSFFFLFSAAAVIAIGRLYDERNQYLVACRLVKEKRVEPFFGEDSGKCHYRCQDYKEVRDEFVITTHSDHTCMKQVTQPRGDKRDWRSK